MLNRLTHLKKRVRDRKGAVALNFALSLIPLMGLVGLAIDGSRMLLARYEFRASLDSAALSVGSTYASQEELETLAEAFVSKNFDVPGTVVNPLTVYSTNEQVHVRGSFRMETFFMGIFGMDQITVGASTEVRRAGGGLMVSLVLDNTGSMWSSNNINSLRNASRSLVEKLFGDDDLPVDLRVSIVPYASVVNPGAVSETIINPTSVPARSDTDKTKWKGCVMERSGTHSIGDTTVAEGGYWTPFMYPPGVDNNFNPNDPDTIIPGGERNSNAITGYNIGCPTPITPLTNSRATIDAAVDALTAWNRGGTLTDIGVAWGIRTMSPQAPFTESTQLDSRINSSLWDSPRWRRAMVIMTDGESTFYDLPRDNRAGRMSAPPNNGDPTTRSDMTGYGRLGVNGTVAKDIFGNNNNRTKINERIESLCTAAKAQGFVIYTVVFTSSVGNDTKDMYRRCASDPGKYWYAPNSNALSASFTQIGTDLSRLRITR